MTASQIVVLVGGLGLVLGAVVTIICDEIRKARERQKWRRHDHAGS